MILEKRFNKLDTSIDFLKNKVKNILRGLSVDFTDSDSLRKLINLITTKRIYPQRLVNNLYGHTSVGLEVDDVLITGGATDRNTPIADNYILNIYRVCLAMLYDIIIHYFTLNVNTFLT